MKCGNNGVLLEGGKEKGEENSDNKEETTIAKGNDKTKEKEKDGGKGKGKKGKKKETHTRGTWKISARR